MRCLSCNYDLANLTEHRCPECGREFDPADPYTFDSPSYRRRRFEKRVLQFGVYGLSSYALTFAAILYLELTSPQPNKASIALLALANWPLTFAMMLLAFKFLFPRCMKYLR